MSYKKLVPNSTLGSKKSEGLKNFYKSLSYDSEVTGKIYLKGLDVDCLEFSGKEGVFFYLSRDGKDLFAVQLKISKI